MQPAYTIPLDSVTVIAIALAVVACGFSITIVRNLLRWERERDAIRNAPMKARCPHCNGLSKPQEGCPTCWGSGFVLRANILEILRRN